MGACSAESFVIYLFADGGSYQVGSCQEYGAGSIDDHGFITHDRQIGAAGHAATHDGGDLNDAHGGHLCIVSENTSAMFFVGEYFILQGEENAGRTEEHTSELQPLMSIPYTVFCLNKTKIII